MSEITKALRKVCKDNGAVYVRAYTNKRKDGSFSVKLYAVYQYPNHRIAMAKVKRPLFYLLEEECKAYGALSCMIVKNPWCSESSFVAQFPARILD